MTEKKVRARVVITGKVQGVFFRAETQRAANNIGGISGWVKNLADGSVEAVFEGYENKVIEILEWCKKGSPHSRVKNVNVTWEEYKGEFAGFDIKW